MTDKTPVRRGTMSDFESQFIDSMRRLREANGWSQAELARRVAAAGVAIPQSAFSKMEAGERRVLLAEALALASVLDKSLTELLLPNWSGPKSRVPSDSHTQAELHVLLTTISLASNEMASAQVKTFAHLMTRLAEAMIK